jgi:hypothetical protein
MAVSLRTLIAVSPARAYAQDVSAPLALASTRVSIAGISNIERIKVERRTR